MNGDIAVKTRYVNWPDSWAGSVICTQGNSFLYPILDGSFHLRIWFCYSLGISYEIRLHDSHRKCYHCSDLYLIMQVKLGS